ncbi:MAG TPA: alpha/beta fold hydrolase [Phycisphaerae bacterium]|nr:alpha/beta fold hydrolase [Phycisphaerae bacterium]
MQNFELAQLRLPDGYTAHARWWRPPNPRGAVLYFHGIQSHGGWYEQSAARLADAGFTVLMPDRRGSGLNPPPRGHFETLPQCLSDTRHALDTLLDQTGEAAAHVVGVSWGGKQAVYLAQALPEKVKSISLVAPGLFPRLDLTGFEKIRVGLAMVHDREKQFDIPLNVPSYFTANPDRLRYVDEDQLKLLKVTARFLITSRNLDKLIRDFHRSPYRNPIHLMLAGHEKIIDNDRTRAWLAALPSPIRRLNEFPEGHHTLEFDANPERFFHALVGWISDLESAPARDSKICEPRAASPNIQRV